MKNLSLLFSVHHQYIEDTVKILVQHPFENLSYTWNGKTLKSINHNTEKIEELAEFEAIIGIEYVQISNNLCLSSESGEIFLFNLDNKESEAVACFGDGIEAMSWSSDQELVVFVTRSPQNVVTMFSTFDPLLEVPLHDESFGDQEFITVGWGKKETQFHGSEGKSAAKKTDEFSVQNTEEISKEVNITWRGDGEFFAVSFVGVNGRMFKVFNKEGILQFTSEKCSILESPIAWRVSGLWIAVPQIYPQKYVITLFEKNGLKHLELILPFRKVDESVRRLSWSSDSEILLIESEKVFNGQMITGLYFYTICNYHWYLKQYLTFDSKINYEWSQNYLEPKILHVLSNTGKYISYKFDYTVSKSSGVSATDESIVAVVDGSQLLLTNFRTQMVPPPMSSYELPLDKRVNFVGFIQKPSDEIDLWDSNSFFTIDFENMLNFYKCELISTKNGHRLRNIVKIKSCLLPESVTSNFTGIYQPMWIDEKKFLVPCGDSLILLNIEAETLSFLDQSEFPKNIGVLGNLGDAYFVELLDGAVSSIRFDDDKLVVDENLQKLPEFCEKVVAIASRSASGEPTIFGMKNTKKKLYRNQEELATEVTSLILEEDYLMYTTISQLDFLDLSSGKMVYTRKLERGSKIVTLIKNKSQVVLQLPRGNLEIISPRILSLKIIRSHLLQQNYCLAFDLMRKERIDLNLLVDLNPLKFVQELDIFVHEIANIQWLNLFLSDLKNEDVTSTSYQFCYNEESAVPEGYEVASKINFLCEKMANIFEKLDKLKYLLPIVTCHVKNGKVESALTLIWDLKRVGTSDEQKKAEEAFRHLLYLIDINVLYNVALGMYDYPMVIFVAQKSQKDPKEYIPFLNELNQLDQHYAKYKIDVHLKRFEKAVEHISNLSENQDKFLECIQLIQKHELFEQGMKSFDGKCEKCHMKICVLYGDHLRMKGKFLDASLMYERGGDSQQALSCARTSLDWQKCIALQGKLGATFEEIGEYIKKMIPSLQENGKYLEIAELIKIYQPQETTKLIEVLIKGKLFTRAFFEAYIAGKSFLVDDLIKPSIVSQIILLSKTVEDDRVLFIQQKQRLLTMREEKLKKRQRIDEGLEDEDLFSDSASIASNSSRYSESSKGSGKTFKSSKIRRKNERKLHNLKEGNKFEDLALIDSIFKLIQKILTLDHQQYIREMLKNSIEWKLDEEGRNLQRSFKNLLLLIKNSLDIIWIPEMMSSGVFPTGLGIDYDLYQNDHFALLRPVLRYKPEMNVIDFEFDLYKDTKKNKEH